MLIYLGCIGHMPDLHNTFSNTLPKIIVQYFQAVKIGKERASKSQMILFKLGGFGMLTLTTKKKDGQFVPIGEEDLVAVIKTVDGYVTILVDAEGYTKAQSKPLEKDAAMQIFKKVRESGIEEYSGKTVEIWTEQYPTVHQDLKG
jgi:hypothetical protein